MVACLSHYITGKTTQLKYTFIQVVSTTQQKGIVMHASCKTHQLSVCKFPSPSNFNIIVAILQASDGKYIHVTAMQLWINAKGMHGVELATTITLGSLHKHNAKQKAHIVLFPLDSLTIVCLCTIPIVVQWNLTMQSP